MAIEKLAFAAAEAEAHAERVKKLEKVLGEEQAENMGRRARQKSKDLSDENDGRQSGECFQAI